MPQAFNDAQQIADRFRSDATVICDLQGCEAPLARRLSDFCSGLVYALQGSLERLDDRVLLLAPHDVELSGGAAADALAKAFFDQI
jgi:cell division inhibitor SepF